MRTDLRIEEDDGAGKALAKGVQGEDWFEEARALAAIEEEPLRFFSDPMRPVGAFSGWVGPAGLKHALADLLRFSPDRPPTASPLSKFGNCGSHGLLRAAVVLESPHALRDELQARARRS